ncbi:DUF2726 domain-containing protein [Rhizobium sp. MC63]|uniref:DUF2726 domain-containing protein n=5 Tax=Rhizobium TaxID=379 RepID=A0A1C3YA74_9HYPH|nr:MULTISPECIES: DUF2726 domain-containing protein [Rhizobium]ANK88276.1 restriction endonuclease domain-containing protein [Rhizobium sp. N731]ANL18522.1 restriction endonuclease domain-containing protein [Rhizobium sp. N1314]ANL37112.1 restriction endonuclease domain-containing protein [Rhizobium phaseoli]ANL43490.1 restriction endonuclease domain-containing protein [Rhizobium phaseoli]ANL62476.1 restriction endonuclease domain-containing protein [Rhizobium phaseoli]
MHYRQRSVLSAAPWLIIGAAVVGASSGVTVADFEKPELLIAALLVGLIIGMSVEQFLTRTSRQAWRERNRSRSEERRWNERIIQEPRLQTPAAEPLRPVDATDQLRIVMRSNFTIQPLLNKSEARVFRELDSVVIGCNSTWQVMAQVSLGEILRSADPDAYSCINSKRVDLLLVDGNCQPRHVIEYQGGAHHQGTAAARDAVKKEALRRAGIGYYEVVAGQTTPSELRRLVEKLVDNPRVT